MTVTVDVGSHYIWMARYFKSYEPRHLLFSNGMQTLGVALPWAISAALVRPKTKVISVSLLSTRIGNSSSFEIANCPYYLERWSLQYGGIPGRNEVRSFIWG